MRVFVAVFGLAGMLALWWLYSSAHALMTRDMQAGFGLGVVFMLAIVWAGIWFDRRHGRLD